MAAGLRLRYEEAALPPHDWRADPDGTALLTAIRRLHAAPGIEIKLRALRARYDGIVSRWLTQRFRPCCLAS